MADGARTRAEAFVAAQRQEERPFLGDAIAFEYLRGSTAEGRAQERWLGGVRLPAGEAPWRSTPTRRRRRR